MKLYQLTLCAAVFAFLLLAGCSGGSGGNGSAPSAPSAPPVNVSDYYPLLNGRTWTYTTTTNNIVQVPYTVACAGPISWQGNNSYVMTSSNVSDNTLYVNWAGNGLVCYGDLVNSATPPQIVVNTPPTLQLPSDISAGYQWTQTSSAGTFTGSVLGITTIVVAAGTFNNALEIQMSTTVGSSNMTSTQTDWYVPGVGMVKQMLTNDTGNRTAELQSYTQ